MKGIFLLLLLFYSFISYADTIVWKNECVGYYQLQLPDNLEVGLYPAERINMRDSSISAIFGHFYKYGYQGKNVESNYSGFFYGNYRFLISRNDVTDLRVYQKNVEKLLSDNYYEYNIKNYWICPYISRHLLSLNPLLACCRRYSRGER